MKEILLSDRKKIYTCLGARNYSQEERQKEDYYATPKIATEKLLKKETFKKNIWECAVGGGHISSVLEKQGYKVIKSDIIKRIPEAKIIDFMSYEGTYEGDIITNPPYKIATEFVEKALETVQEGNKIAMFLKLQFLEGQKRKILFEKNPPYKVLVFSKRVSPAKNGDFEKYNNGAIAYAWFIWIKGYVGKPSIEWI